MDGSALITILISVIVFAAMGVGVVLLRSNSGSSQAAFRGMMRGNDALTPRRRGGIEDEEMLLDVAEIKQRSGKASFRGNTEDVSKLLFKAGFFTPEDRKRFQLARIVLPFITVPLGIAAGYFFDKGLAFQVVFVFFGVASGLALPLRYLRGKITQREEETLYYLPLVIEQISIGVSSSLDIGPCISEVVRMADERDSHNPVTEMFVHTEKLMRSGLSLEEGLIEVSEVNGQTEVKHAFMFLAQCAKHGGEISRQLQELADATMVQRQTYVEGRIAALPVKATGPLATVFAGFFGLLFAGLMVRLFEAFGGGMGGGG